MSQENVEVVRRAFEAFNRGGVTACVSEGLWSPEIVIDASAAGIVGLGVYRGYDEVRRLFEEDWLKAFPLDELELEVEELIDHGDRVVVKARQRGRGAGSGAPVELHYAQVCSLRDGQAVRVALYSTYQDALEAAGLSE